MSRVLLIGHNPPCVEVNARVEAANYRTWQFLEPLVADGHAICLCAEPPSQRDYQPALPADWDHRVSHQPIPLGRRMGWAGQLQAAHDAFQPDCVVAVNFDRCLCATKLRTDRPIWMDIYGDYLTVVQAARYRAGSDRGIPTSIGFARQVLRKGDAFSVCSTRQKHMLVGELAMSGRLNSRSFAYPFVHVVLPGAAPRFSDSSRPGRRSMLPAHGVPEESFVVLWCGGYNTWTDVDTLFAGIESAMAAEERVHFVSVGASTYDGPDDMYARFESLAGQSPHRGRYHLLGWRPWTEIESFYRECDVGLNIDALHYETVYGTRTRLIEMMAAGLPVITSLGTELSELISEKGAGLVFEPHDGRNLGKHILALARSPHLCAQLASRALDCAAKELSFEATTAPVRAWVGDPRRAPDTQRTSIKEKVQHLEYRGRSAVRQAIWRIAGLDS